MPRESGMKFSGMTILFISKWVAEKAFITGMAKANPEINYIGIDIQKSVLSYALDKVLEADLPNIKLLWVDGDSLTNYFEDGEIDRLYLNFSDPWPKKRHEKRRLTYKTFWIPSSKFFQNMGRFTLKQIIEVCLNTVW